MRPKLDKSISTSDFKNHYWLKEELIAFCKEIGISSNGGKLEITARIIHYLDNGEIPFFPVSKEKKSYSTFDWNNATLDKETIITDNYKNTENVRSFFCKTIGLHFKFNVAFMDWMKANTGKTLDDACTEWTNISKQKKEKTIKTDIAPQFEYNTFIRDFLLDNPQQNLKDAINCWNIKRQMPGSKKYSKTDLNL